MTMTKRAASIAAILVACLVMFVAATAPGVQRAFAHGDPMYAEHHYNDDVQSDGITWNDFNFGPNRFEWATDAVRKGDSNNVLEFIYTNDGSDRGGDFIKSINPHNENTNYDGALLAAVCLHVENKTGMIILVDEQNEPIGRRADAAHLHFHEDRAYAEACYDRLASIFDHAIVHVQEIGSYTSSMYQWYKGLNGNMPSVIVRDSENNGGHALVFDLGEKVGLIRFRLECGYQPIDTDDYWPTPDKPVIPEPPGPSDPPDPDTPPGPSDPPDPDTPLEPKDPDAGPQAQIDPDTSGYEDFGGGPNHDPITDITGEPEAPDQPYVAPKPPEAETPSQPAPAQQPSQPHGQDESGAVTPGHDTDYQSGQTESYTDPDTGDTGTGTVVVGDGEDHGDFTDIVQDDIDGNTTPEPGLDPSDGSGNGEVSAPE